MESFELKKGANMVNKLFWMRLLQKYKEQGQISKGRLFVLAFLVLGMVKAGAIPERDIWEDHKENLEKKPQKLDLSKTAIGQAAQEGRFEDFFRELQALKDQTPEERLEILQAKDTKGNSLFHFMAVPPKKKAEFAGAILYLSGVLAAHGDYETLDNWNQAQLTPLEVAKKVDNPIAMEYLLIAENQIKKLRAENVSRQEIEELPGLDLEQNLSGIQNKAILGGLVFLYGYMFISTGIELGSLGHIFLGVPQLIFGGSTCYQAFKSWKVLKDYNKS